MEFLKNLIKFVLLPVAFLWVMVVLTGQLLIERNALISEVSSDWYPGVGVSTPKHIEHNKWTPYYGGGEGIDTVIAREDWSLRVSTGGDGGWYGAKSVLATNDFSASSISFSFRIHDWDQVDRVLLLFSSDADFSNYYGINLKNYFAKPANSEWIDVVIDKAEFMVMEGSPDWSNITDMAVRVVSVPGVSTRVWFDEFSLVPKVPGQAVITLTFDDGFSAVMQASDIMNQYDMKGTAFIIPEFLEDDGYLSQGEVDKLSDLGWDISGHSKDNLTEMISPDVDTVLAATSEYLTAGGYQGANHFAYPNGAYNHSVRSQVQEYFSSARTIDGFYQPKEYLNPSSINAFTVSSSTKITEITDKIDTAVANGTWLVLVWHDFNTDPVEDVEYHIDDFEWIVKYLDEQNVRVEPYSVAYNEMANL